MQDYQSSNVAQSCVCNASINPTCLPGPCMLYKHVGVLKVLDFSQRRRQTSLWWCAKSLATPLRWRSKTPIFQIQIKLYGSILFHMWYRPVSFSVNPSLLERHREGLHEASSNVASCALTTLLTQESDLNPIALKRLSSTDFLTRRWKGVGQKILTNVRMCASINYRLLPLMSLPICKKSKGFTDAV